MNITFAHETLSSCPLCTDTPLSVRFRNISGDRALYRCRACGIQILLPFPGEDRKEAIYDHTYYERWGYNERDREIIAAIKKHLYADVLKEVLAYIKPSTVLDIGCAMGFSLEVLKENGIAPYGIEISGFAGTIAREKFADVVKIGDVEKIDFGPERFGAVTMVDVIEHVKAPLAVLKKVHSLISDSGLLAIVVPDVSSFTSKIMGRMWPHLKDEHLYYYSPRSISRALSQTGFRVECIKPFPKPLTLLYGEHVLRCSSNKLPYHVAHAVCKVLPRTIKAVPFKLPMGEILVIARRMTDETKNEK